MVKQYVADVENKIQIVPLIVGLIVIFFCGYIMVKIFVKIFMPPKVFLYIFVGLVILGIGFVIYLCIKNPEFKDKTLSLIKRFLAGLSKLGNDVFKGVK